MPGQIHVHIDIDGPGYEAAYYAFQVLLASSEVPVVFHRARPFLLSPEAVLITYSCSRIEPVHHKHLVICASRRLWEHYGREKSLPPLPLLRVPLAALGVRASARLQDPLVLPYASEAAPAGAEFVRDASTGSDVSIVTGADVVASAFFWITRYEESLISERDEVGRIPEERLRVIQEGLTRRPLVDEYSELLITWLEMLGLRVGANRRPFRVVLTHDVDSGIGVRGFWEHADNGLRTLYQETVRQRRPRTGLVGLGQWALRGVGLQKEAELFRDIVTLDAEFGFPSFFFLMSNGTHPRDASYDICSDAAQGVIKAIREAGGGIGLHVGLNAHTKSAQLRSEWERLRQAAPQARPVSRSHYLAFFSPTTWRQLLELGFTADSTLGFSRYSGFRCGTCRAFRPFDIERREILSIWELPLTVMDVNLFFGQPMESDTTRVSAVADLAACVKAHGGCLVLNWHNVYCFGHYRKVYRAILAELRGGHALSPDNLPAANGVVIW
ncbi:MAG: polysaccharide deacetylase family protein [Acidobacteria bacterium]|nr:polysaccharide deacetylase family protein [Acidobacteriota bacterium]